MNPIKKINIFEVLDRLHISYGVKHTHQIRCPFHDDLKPSARIYEDSNTIYCWVCNKTWDNLELVRDVLGLSYKDGVEWFRKRFGVKLEKLERDRRYDIFSDKKPKYRKNPFRVKAEEELLSFCASKDLGEYGREIKIWILEEYSKLKDISLEDCVDWLDSSKALIRYATSVENEVKDYSPQY